MPDHRTASISGMQVAVVAVTGLVAGLAIVAATGFATADEPQPRIIVRMAQLPGGEVEVVEGIVLPNGQAIVTRRGGAAVLTEAPPPLSDEQLLAKAGLDKADGPALLEYLKKRTISEGDLARVQELIRRLGSDAFDARREAVQQIVAIGAAAIGPLKAAVKDPDPEIAYRARQALQELEKVPQGQIIAAVARRLAVLRPAGAAEVLLQHAPLSDDEATLQAIQHALIQLAVRADGKPEPALLAALSDRLPLRRRLAAIALIEGGPPQQRIRIPDAYPRVRDAVRQETVLDNKFHGLWSLFLTTREPEYLPELLDLIPQLPRGYVWQLEDLLLQLSGGEHPPGGRFGRNPDSLPQARDAWRRWWNDKSSSLNLATFTYTPRIRGVTEIIEHDIRGFPQSRILQLGPDLKERWSLAGLNHPLDMKVLPNGNILVAETNNNRLAEYTPQGGLVRSQMVNHQPIAVQPLPEERLLVICRNNVYLFDKNWKVLAQHPRPNFDIFAGCALPGGDVLIIRNVAQGAQGVRLDAKLQETRTTHSFARLNYMQSVAAIDAERVLVCEYNRVAEYNLKTGKLLWHHSCNNPTSAQRLPNGNTLITLMHDPPHGRAIELDPSGEIVWEYRGSEPGLRPLRVWRR